MVIVVLLIIRYGMPRPLAPLPMISTVTCLMLPAATSPIAGQRTAARISFKPVR